jgi:hypothetical protein
LLHSPALPGGAHSSRPYHPILPSFSFPLFFPLHLFFFFISGILAQKIREMNSSYKKLVLFSALNASALHYAHTSHCTHFYKISISRGTFFPAYPVICRIC